MVLSIVFTFLFISIMVGIFDLLIAQNRLAQKTRAKEVAFPIAEAGINYYRWHLSQDKNDYADGCNDSNPGSWCAGAVKDCVYPNMCGPYIHDYYDPLLNEKIGEFKLYITPPPSGSTVVTIKSTGWLNGFANQSKTIEAKYGLPSLAAYTFLSNSDAWFADNERVTGPIHSNGGIRMDGINESMVSSAQSTYTCVQIDGCTPPKNSPGVWRTDGTVNSLWQFPVLAVNFTLNLNQIRADSQTSGIYYSDSGAEGYKIIFKNDGTFDVYIIQDLQAAEKQYNDDWTEWQDIADEPNNLSFPPENRTAPSNGIIFIEDNAWIEGEVKGRFTLVSAKLTGNPADYTTIRINGNITYANRDSANILGLIAEKDIKVPKYAPDVLTIDAIMLAQNGRVFYNRYSSAPIKTSIEIYGSIITNKIWKLKWCAGIPCNPKDGYNQTTIIYDNNAVFSPPPYFPNTGKYTFISWKEKIAN